MPTYEYACRSCGSRLEAVQKFTDDALTECPECGGELRKVFGNVGIVFKGSGFYKNDSRSSSETSKASPSASAPSESTPSTSTDGAATAPATTPAPAPAPSAPTPAPTAAST